MQDTTQHTAVTAGMHQYFATKDPNDIDLVATVRKLMIESGLQVNAVANYDNNHFILDAANKASNVQRFLLNRYWTIQLINCPMSIEQRYCLIPNGTVEDWLNLFTSKILPFIIQHNLPKSI